MIDGTYKIKAADREGSVALTAKDTKVHAQVSVMGFDIEGDGTTDGTNFELAGAATVLLMPVEYEVKGSVDGDSISGTVVAVGKNIPFTGTRV